MHSEQWQIRPRESDENEDEHNYDMHNVLSPLTESLISGTLLNTMHLVIVGKYHLSFRCHIDGQVLLAAFTGLEGVGLEVVLLLSGAADGKASGLILFGNINGAIDGSLLLLLLLYLLMVGNCGGLLVEQLMLLIIVFGQIHGMIEKGGRRHKVIHGVSVKMR